MKIRSAILLIVLLLGITSVSAQGNLNTVTTSSGLSLSYNETQYLYSEVSPDFLTLVSIDTGTDTQTYMIYANDGIGQYMGMSPVPTTAADFIEAHLETMSFLGATLDADDPVALELSNGVLTLVRYEFATNPHIVGALELSTGELVVIDAMALLGDGEEIYLELSDRVLTLAEGISFGGNAGPTEPGAEGEVSISLANPIDFDTLPEGTIITQTGAIFTYLPEFAPFAEQGNAIENAVLFFSEAMDVSALITVFGEQADQQVSLIKTILAPGIVGDNYDVDAWQVLTTDQGLEAEAYINSNDAVDVLLMIELGADKLAYIQIEAGSEQAFQDNQAGLEAIINSIRRLTAEDVRAFDLEVVTETIGGPVVETGEIGDGDAVTVSTGERVIVQEINCATPGLLHVREETPVAALICPPGCTALTVWGSDPYTSDSSICTAAAHAGAIQLTLGGLVEVTYMPGQEEYPPSEANGITTSRWASWPDSFSVAPLDAGQ